MESNRSGSSNNKSNKKKDATMSDTSSSNPTSGKKSSSSSQPQPQQQQRTIQVKIGNQAAQSMTPDQAAEYLKSIAERGAFGAAAAGVGGSIEGGFCLGSTAASGCATFKATFGGVGSSGGSSLSNSSTTTTREVKFTFGNSMATASLTSSSGGSTITHNLASAVDAANLTIAQITPLNKAPAVKKRSNNKKNSSSISNSNATTTATSTTTTSANASNTTTFGPKLPPVGTSTSNTAATSNRSAFSASDSSSSAAAAHALASVVSSATTAAALGSLDLAALTAGVGGKSFSRQLSEQTNSSWNSNSILGGNNNSFGIDSSSSNYSSSSSSSRKDGMPCSEKEMKALMSMFVEIMGLQMNTEKLNQAPPSLSSTAAAAAAGNTSGTLADDKDEEDSLPALEDVESWDRRLQRVVMTTTSALTTEPTLAAAATAPAAAGTKITTTSLMTTNPSKKNNKNSNNNNNKGLSNVTSTTSNGGPRVSNITGKAGIAAFEWEALERVAIEDALEQEERARKAAAKKRDNNTSSSNNNAGNGGGSTTTSNVSSKSRTSKRDRLTRASLRHAGAGTAVAQAVQAAAAAADEAAAATKQWQKLVSSWRSKVVSACQAFSVTGSATDLQLLQTFLRGSPLLVVGTVHSGNGSEAAAGSAPVDDHNKAHDIDNEDMADSIRPHLESLVPYCLSKNRNWKGRRSGRELIAAFILALGSRDSIMGLNCLLSPLLLRNGRSAFHMACFYGDLSLARQVLHKAADVTSALTGSPKAKKLEKLIDWKTTVCHDSGWGALHYAAVSGSITMVEFLLSHGATVKLPTADTHTWWRQQPLPQAGRPAGKDGGGGGGGVTARELIEVIVDGSYDKLLETHGMALQEVVKDFLINSSNSNMTSNSSSNNNNSTIHSLSLEKRQYLAMLEIISERLRVVETSGYVQPLSGTDIVQMEQAAWEKAVAEEEKEKKLQQEEALQKQQQQQEQELEDKKQKQQQNDEHEKTDNQKQVSLGADDEKTNTSVATDTTLSTGSKKNKKKKKKGAAASVNPATAAQPPPTAASSSKVPASSALRNDPLVTALFGMGFSEEQIAAGIKSCGGIDRATADDVIAWIFGQEASGGDSPDVTAAAAGNSQASGKRETVIETESDRKVNRVTPQMESKDSKAKEVEAARREEEARVAAEQLAAKKREEQRRRNREWNNKAHLRQKQEAEEKLAKAAELKARAEARRNGLAPASKFLPTVAPGGIPNLNYTPSSLAAPAMGALKQPPQQQQQARFNGSPPLVRSASSAGSSRGPDTSEYANDDGTMTSYDHGSVEFGNDDATVSTMGSMQQTRTAPVVSSAPSMNLHTTAPLTANAVLPPGFGTTSSVATVPESQPMPMSSMQHWRAPAPAPAGALNPFGLSLNHMQTVPPLPGLSESKPLLDQRPPTATGLPSLGGLQSRMSAAQEAFASNNFAHGSSSMIRSSFSHMPPVCVDPASFFSSAPSSLHGFERIISSSNNDRTSPVPHSVDSSVSGPSVPTPLAFGFDAPRGSITAGSVHTLDSRYHSQTLDPDTIDSSIIDSISTGNSMIGGAALWGDHSPSNATGSSLLGNLIQTSRLERDSNDMLYSQSDDNGIQLVSDWGKSGVGGVATTAFSSGPSLNTGGNSIW